MTLRCQFAPLLQFWRTIEVESPSLSMEGVDMKRSTWLPNEYRDLIIGLLALLLTLLIWAVVLAPVAV